MRFEHAQVYGFEGALRGMRNPLASWKRADSLYGLEKYDDMPEYEVAAAWVEATNPDLDKEDYKYEILQDKYAEWLRNNGILKFNEPKNDYVEYAFIGPKDMDLAERLMKAGPEHRKFLRQIQVSVDITAPLYWWKEFDTYKVGTTANSTSTMHKLASTPITIDCFEIDDYEPYLVLAETDNTKYTVDGFVATEGIDYTLIAFLEGLRQKYNETKDKCYWKELVRWLPNGWLQTRTVTMNYENLRTICHQREGHKLTEWHQFIQWVDHYLPYSGQFIFGKPVALD